MTQTLLPCPFCGGTKFETFANVIVCEECEAHGPCSQEGIEATMNPHIRDQDWNRRSTLPIAVEGKVKALEWSEDSCGNWFSESPFGSEFIQKWKYSGIDKTVFEYEGTNYDTAEAAKAAAQSDYETRILSALPSSPGKDGGQEVEAVVKAADDALVSAIHAVFDNGVFVKDELLAPAEVRERVAKAIRSVASQPASTALVERLTSALLKAEEVLANYADPTGYTDGYGDPVPADAVQHEGLLAQEALDVVRSALSSSLSTSREGESK